ncbi:MAG: M28 family peptidase [Bacteroidota bacterium]
MKKILHTLLALSIYLNVNAQHIDEKEIRQHIEYLASDKLGGREPGTEGEKLAVKYIEKQFRSYKLKPLGTDGYKQPFTYKTRSHPHDTIGLGQQKTGTNVIAFLDNGAANTIVIGGHFDHLGFHEHTSSMDKDKTQIHNGADDNASGTAGVLALAKYFAGNGVTEQSNFLFMCYSAEEDGLIGSKYFTNNPTLDLKKMSCMLNMDMIGRLNDSTEKLMIFGVGTSPVYTKVFASVKHNFKLGFDSSGVGPSDQTSFYLKNIPVLHFFTGQHTDYHKSSDDTEKINFKGEVRVLDLIRQLALVLSNEQSIPFTPTKQPETQRVSFKVTLGIMPDYSFEGKGLKVDGVTEGKPAQKAGVLSGDVLMKLGEISISNMQDYMKALGSFKKGEEADLQLMRNNELKTMKVTF